MSIQSYSATNILQALFSIFSKNFQSRSFSQTRNLFFSVASRSLQKEKNTLRRFFAIQDDFEFPENEDRNEIHTREK